MPLKRIFASNPRKRLHQRAPTRAIFVCWWTMRAEALQYSPKSHEQLPRATEERSHASPRNTPLLPLKFKNTFTFAPFGLRKSRGNTNAPQKIINFCPFSACFALIRGYLGAPIVQSRPDRFRRSQCAGVLPMLLANRERKPTRKEGTQQAEEPEPPA